jgi:hypothetical protein
MIYARPPQAQGRIERQFETLQDRMLLMMRHRGIATIEEANAFVTGKFLPHWDDKHAHPPLHETNVHRSVDGLGLEGVLSVHVPRTITNDYTFQYNSKTHSKTDLSKAERR